MDHTEASSLLKKRLEGYAAKPLAELMRLVDEPDAGEIVGSSSVVYQVEILAVWDDEAQRQLRLIGAIDDRSLLGTISPLSMGFVVNPQD